jgi:hypothetical protein
MFLQGQWWVHDNSTNGTWIKVPGSNEWMRVNKGASAPLEIDGELRLSQPVKGKEPLLYRLVEEPDRASTPARGQAARSVPKGDLVTPKVPKDSLKPATDARNDGSKSVKRRRSDPATAAAEAQDVKEPSDERDQLVDQLVKMREANEQARRTIQQERDANDKLKQEMGEKERQLEAKLQEAEQRVAVAEEKAASVEAAAKETQKKLEDESKELQARLEKACAEVASLETMAVEVGTKAQAAEQVAMETENEKQALQRELDAKSTHLSEARSLIDDLQRRLDAKEQELAETVETMQARERAEAEARLELQRIGGEGANLRASAERANTEAAELREKVASLEWQLAEAQRMNEELQLSEESMQEKEGVTRAILRQMQTLAQQAMRRAEAGVEKLLQEQAAAAELAGTIKKLSAKVVEFETPHRSHATPQQRLKTRSSQHTQQLAAGGMASSILPLRLDPLLSAGAGLASTQLQQQDVPTAPLGADSGQQAGEGATAAAAAAAGNNAHSIRMQVDTNNDLVNDGNGDAEGLHPTRSKHPSSGVAEQVPETQAEGMLVGETQPAGGQVAGHVEEAVDSEESREEQAEDAMPDNEGGSDVEKQESGAVETQQEENMEEELNGGEADEEEQNNLDVANDAAADGEGDDDDDGEDGDDAGDGVDGDNDGDVAEHRNDEEAGQPVDQMDGDPGDGPSSDERSGEDDSKEEGKVVVLEQEQEQAPINEEDVEAAMAVDAAAGEEAEGANDDMDDDDDVAGVVDEMERDIKRREVQEVIEMLDDDDF